MTDLHEGLDFTGWVRGRPFANFEIFGGTFSRQMAKTNFRETTVLFLNPFQI
jgi:hypothetical protein